MAEFCLECWNKLNGTKYDKDKYIISKDLDLCEGCGEWKHIIIMARNAYKIPYLCYISLPIEILQLILSNIWKLMLLIFNYIKTKL